MLTNSPPAGRTVPAAARPRRAPTHLDDTVSAILGLVIVGAVYFDGRAHVLELPDSFFTPWHAFLYGGLLALMAWLLIVSIRTAARSGESRIAVIADGYGYAVIGAGMFALGGVTDMVWHEVFGVEFGIEALLSPTHLLLFVGGSLMMTGPLRAFLVRAGRGTSDRGLPAILSVIGISAIAAFAFAFLSGFLTTAAASAVLPEGAHGHSLSEERAAVGLASYVISSLILVISIRFLITVKLARPGVVALVVTSLAVLSSVIENFDRPSIIVAALAAGILADGVLAILRRRGVRERAQSLVIAAVVPIAVWSAQLVALATTYGVRWSVALVTGVVALSAISSVLVVLVVGRPVPGLRTDAGARVEPGSGPEPAPGGHQEGSG